MELPLDPRYVVGSPSSSSNKPRDWAISHCSGLSPTAFQAVQPIVGFLNWPSIANPNHTVASMVIMAASDFSLCDVVPWLELKVRLPNCRAHSGRVDSGNSPSARWVRVRVSEKGINTQNTEAGSTKKIVSFAAVKPESLPEIADLDLCLNSPTSRRCFRARFYCYDATTHTKEKTSISHQHVVVSISLAPSDPQYPARQHSPSHCRHPQSVTPSSLAVSGTAK